MTINSETQIPDIIYQLVENFSYVKHLYKSIFRD